jgi:uncharacterized protein (DUF433 family)
MLYLLVSTDVRQHRLISRDYITTLRGHGRGRGFESRRPRHSFPQIDSPVAFNFVLFAALPLARNVYYRLMPVGWKNHTVSDPEILRGKPRLKGTRISVGLVLGYLAAGKTAMTSLLNFRTYTRSDRCVLELWPRTC